MKPAALLLACALVSCGVRVSDPLEPLDPGMCLYCGPPGCGAGPWHPCDVREALGSQCAGHAPCDEPPGKVGWLDAGREDGRAFFDAGR